MRFTVSSFLLVLTVAGLASTATPAAAADRYCLQGGGWGPSRQLRLRDLCATQGHGVRHKGDVRHQPALQLRPPTRTYGRTQPGLLMALSRVEG